MTRRRTLLPLLLAALLVAAGCGAQGADSPPDASATTPAPTAATPLPTPFERVIGWVAIHEMPGAASNPSLDPNDADAVIRGELAAGRATLATEAAGVPPMRTIDGGFSPALVRVLGPAGQTVFTSSTPVAAWVIVMEGRGVDGRYFTIGVVADATGIPLATYVVTPGSG